MRTLVLVLVLVVSGCDGSPPPTTPATPTTSAPVGPQLADDSELAATRAAIQGTFAMPWWRGGAERHPEIWSIDGDTLSRWDGSQQEQAKITVVARCLAKIEWPDDTFTYQEIVVDGATVWFGESGGSTLAARTVVCSSLGVWVQDGTTCTKWSPGGFSSHRSGLHAEPATCAVAKDGAFEADGKRWPKRGDVFLAADFDTRKPTAPQRFDSLDAAKAAAN